MRKVELTMDEQKKYETIKSLVDHNGNKKRAALELDLSTRQIDRLVQGYKEHGKQFFVHGNRGRKPPHTLHDELRNTIVDLYRTKYYDANFTHYTELLESFEGISLSVSAVSSILESAGIYSPRLTRAKKKRIKDELNKKMELASSDSEKHTLLANLVALEDAHSRRPRSAYFGELIQMDASSFAWFPGMTTSLHIAVDDSSSSIVGAFFDKEETLNGYYNVFHQILTIYGIPYKLFTDRRSVFTYKKKHAPSIDQDSYTQFAYACKQLGVELQSSSVPQAKGRVERMFETLQSRLPIEMRLAGVTDISSANQFLVSYLRKFNQKFSLPVNYNKSVFETQPSEEKINLTLAVLAQRTVDSGHCIRFQKNYYRLLDHNGLQVHYKKNTKVMIIKAFDGKLFCCVNDSSVYALEAIPQHASKSKDIDFVFQKQPPKKTFIPPMTHPWKKASFDAFARRQKHHLSDSLKDSA